ncbi:MAG TPA: hypothetical protein VH482_08650 [Thermomicrobiales bacterium]
MAKLTILGLKIISGMNKGRGEVQRSGPKRICVEQHRAISVHPISVGAEPSCLAPQTDDREVVVEVIVEQIAVT